MHEDPRLRFGLVFRLQPLTFNPQPLIPNPQPPTPRSVARSGFTLVELLITVSVIGIMASMMMFALFSAQETAKVHKTKALIAKLDAIIKAKYESYKTRRVPLDIQDEFNDINGNGTPDAGEFSDLNGNGTCDPGEYPDYNGDGMPNAYSPTVRAQMRLECLRDLMRMELPDRWTDIDDPPTSFPYVIAGNTVTVSIPRPSVSAGFKRRYDSIVNRTTPPPPAPADLGKNAGSECLYMIIMQAQQEDADDRSVIKPDMIGDTDGDGFPEILDAWGTPIKFLRWAPGFDSELQVVARVAPPYSVTPGPTTTIRMQSAQLSTTPGAYIGGAVAKFSPGFPSVLMPDSAARILDYAVDTSISPPKQTFTATNAGSAVTGAELFVIFAPDPFDPLHVSPKPSWNLYPLIYSAGPDKEHDICADYGTATGFLHYSADRDNPCTKGTDPAINAEAFIGSPRNNPSITTVLQWLDNIHNHMITAR